MLNVDVDDPTTLNCALFRPQTAFRTGTSTRLDDRVFSMCQMKALPLDQMMRYIYPDFYMLDPLFSTDEGDKIDPPRLQLSSER